MTLQFVVFACATLIVAAVELPKTHLPSTGLATDFIKCTFQEYKDNHGDLLDRPCVRDCIINKQSEGDVCLSIVSDECCGCFDFHHACPGHPENAVQMAPLRRYKRLAR